ncbi:MAG: hypothetical protein KA436_08465 [Oligoflexales bacterium]|nr:hypothetical protein [Oligoflexales bacterium]
MIAHMDRDELLPVDSAGTMAGYKMALSNLSMSKVKWLTKKLNEISVDYLGNEFILPVKYYLQAFLKEDTKFDCKISEDKRVAGAMLCDGLDASGSSFIKMRLVARKRDMISYFSKPDAQFIMHFCATKPGTIRISRDADEFWNSAHLEKSSKQNLYKNTNELDLNGVVLVISRTEKKELAVSDYRVSVGPVETESAEYREFVDKDCIYYTGDHKK